MQQVHVLAGVRWCRGGIAVVRRNDGRLRVVPRWPLLRGGGCDARVLCVQQWVLLARWRRDGVRGCVGQLRAMRRWVLVRGRRCCADRVLLLGGPRVECNILQRVRRCERDVRAVPSGAQLCGWRGAARRVHVHPGVLRARRGGHGVRGHGGVVCGVPGRVHLQWWPMATESL